MGMKAELRPQSLCRSLQISLPAFWHVCGTVERAKGISEVEPGKVYYLRADMRN